MASPFETVITKLVNIGFYDFLLFLLALPILFAILKKTKMLGDSTPINGLVAFIGSFLIFSFPIITGVSMTYSLTNMFMQLMMWVLIVVFALLIAGFFYPDLMGTLAKKFTSRSMLFVAVAIGLTIAIASGFLPAVFGALSSPEAPPGPIMNTDVTTLVIGIVIFMVVLVIAGAVTLQTD